LTPSDTASALILARLYLHNSRMKDARRVLQRARHYKPNEAALWELTVKAAESLQDEEAPYRELLHRFPDEPKYAVALGANLITRGEHAKAQAVLEPIVRKGVPSATGQVHYQLARSYYLQDKVVQALEHLETAEEEDPESINTVSALQLKARVYEKLGRAKD